MDDIEVNRIIWVKILSSLGADCDTAANGQQAVEKFEAARPGEYDLILMDVQMPVMNGYEAAIQQVMENRAAQMQWLKIDRDTVCTAAGGIPLLAGLFL